MARKALAFLLLLGTQVMAGPAFAAAGADGFENLDRLEGRLVGALNADVGQPGGPATHIDRRLKLQPCPVPATIDPPALGAVALRCEPLGWRIRIPLTHGTGTAAPGAGFVPVAAAAPSQPVAIKRGDPVELAATRDGFTVTTQAVAQEDGRIGGRIRVRPEKGNIIIGEVVDAGRVRVTSF